MSTNADRHYPLKPPCPAPARDQPPNTEAEPPLVGGEARGRTHGGRGRDPVDILRTDNRGRKATPVPPPTGPRAGRPDPRKDGRRTAPARRRAGRDGGRAGGRRTGRGTEPRDRRTADGNPRPPHGAHGEEHPPPAGPPTTAQSTAGGGGGRERSDRPGPARGKPGAAGRTKRYRRGIKNAGPPKGPATTAGGRATRLRAAARGSPAQRPGTPRRAHRPDQPPTRVSPARRRPT